MIEISVHEAIQYQVNPPLVVHLALTDARYLHQWWSFYKPIFSWPYPEHIWMMTNLVIVQAKEEVANV